MKHTFNAEGDTERLLQAAHKALRDKTEFINRCIRESGEQVLTIISDERKEIVAAVLRETAKDEDENSLKKPGTPDTRPYNRAPQTTQKRRVILRPRFDHCGRSPVQY